MPNPTTRKARRTLNVLAAGLVASTMLAGAVAVQSIPAFAQGKIEAIDPTKGFAPLVEHVMPSVVSVEVKFEPAAATRDGRNDMENVPPQMREFFEQFPGFRDRFEGRERRSGGVGSGFVVTADGYVVTNNHVVNGTTMVKVKFQGGGEYDAKVIGSDSKTDLALLKIQSDRSFDFVPFAANDSKVGDWVMAVGNPFGLGGTVTAGIVSARGRDIGSGPYDDYMQIDASINKGNSGGPAFNLEGEVVGVNTAIFSPSGGSVGIGFAIPASIVKDVVEDLKTNGAVTRGWLGVQIQPVTADIAESLGLEKAEGAIVSGFTEKSPAAKAGLKAGDTILKANGETIDNAKDLSLTVAGLKPGTAVPFEIIRNGKAETVTVEIGTMPGEMPRMAAAGSDEEQTTTPKLGVAVVPADDGAGVRITEVDPNSSAAERGLKPGDVILEVAGKEVSQGSDVTAALKSAKGKKVLILIRSGDSQRFITLPANQG
jgi:serine protease Do